MTGLVRRATLFAGLGVLVAGAAMAGVPNAGNSTKGTVVILGGQSGGVVDVRVEKTITVRDAANNVVPNSVVVLNLTNCTSQDIRLCSVQSFANMFINCAAKTVSAVTNGSGVATFRVIGGATNNGANSAGAGAGCASVTADGVNLGTLTVAAADENNAGGVDVSDTAAFFSDRFGSYRGRSDFDGDGLMGVGDTAGFMNIRFGGGSPSSCTSSNCP